MKCSALPAGIILAIVLFTSCGASTDVLSSWSPPEYTGRTFDYIVVLALSNDLEARKTVEQEVADRLRKEGIRAEPGVRVFPPGFFAQKPEETAIREILAERGADGALVVSVLDIREKTRHVPGQTTYRPTQYYSEFYGYWSTVYEQVNTPGYTATSADIFLESNLYDVESSELLWSGQSLTGDPRTIGDLARSYGSAIVTFLLDEGIVTK